MATTQLRGSQLKDKSVTKQQLADDLNLALTELAEGAELVKRDGSVALTGNLDAGTHQLKNTADATDAKDAVNLSQLQTAISAMPNPMEYKGQYDAVAAVLPTTIDIGDVYVVKGTGIFNGEAIQEGAELIAKTTKATGVTAADFDVVDRQDQVLTVNGKKGVVVLAAEDLTGMTASTAELNFAKGVTSAIQTQLDAKIDKTAIDTDTTLADSSDDKVASSKAVKVYVDATKTDLQNQISAAVVKISTFVDEEVPVGTIDGVNKVFTLANSPAAGSVKLYLNGQRYRAGAENDFVIADKVITMVEAPVVNDTLFADYRNAEAVTPL